MDLMPSFGPVGAGHPILGGTTDMDERAEFRDEITLSRDEVLDVVARCEEVAIYAEGIGEVSVAVSVDSVRRFLLGRLQGAPGGLDD